MDSAKQTTPIDISEVKKSITGKRTDLVPTIVIRSEPSGTDEANAGKVHLLEKIIKTEILLNVFLVLLLAAALYVSFVLRFDIIRYVSKNTSPAGSLPGQPTEEPAGADADFRVVAAEEQSSPAEPISPLYITSQALNLDKSFDASSSGRLTIFGKLKNEVLGFLPFWIIPRITQIDTRAVTSVSYFGLDVDGNGEIIKNDASGKPVTAWAYLQKDANLENFLRKAKNSRIKIYVTLKCFNQDDIVALTTSEKARENFINAALYLMSSKSLDGINVDFEYIGTPQKEVRDGFSALIIALNKAMKEQFPASRLTIDTFIDAAASTRLHDIPTLAQNSDGLVVMGYDFHTPKSPVPGPVAPMAGAGLSIKGLMASYLEKAPSDKLILGVPYYGYDWPVGQSNNKLVVTGTKNEVNIVPYGEIAAVTKNTQILWDENAQVPYYSYQDPVTKQTRVVYFENVRSLGVKYDYIMQNKLQGTAIWALGFDGKRVELNQTLVDKFSE